MTFFRQIFAVARKDLLLEWRSPARVSSVFFFALAVVLVAAFSTGAGALLLRKQAAGTLWFGLLLASTRSLEQSFRVEVEQGALEGLVLWPVDLRAVFYGKAIANTVVLVAVAFALLPLVIAIHDAPVNGSWSMLVAFIVLGSAAIAAPGTLYSAIATRARGASVLLPVLLFPLVVPALIATTRGTLLLIEGDAMGDTPAWLGLLFAFDAIHWSLTGLLFSRIVEET